MGNSIRMPMAKFNEFIQKVYNDRPFSMYFHGCDKDNSEFMVNNPHSSFRIFERNSIASTVVNGGRVTTDYHARLQEYVYSNTNSNLVLIMPDSISIERYCGAVEGQVGVTTGYANHIELDYTIMAVTQVLNGKEVQTPYLEEAKNCLIMGYYDHDTDEFVINKNCILFQNQEIFDDLTSKSRELANRQYTNNLNLELMRKCMFGARSPEESQAFERIFRNPELTEIYRQSCHINYMQSDEAKYDADTENTNLLIDYHNPSPSHALETMRSMADNIISSNETPDDTGSDII